MWNAECGMAVPSSRRGASHALDAGTSIPHSAFRTPHSAMQFSYLLSQLGHDFEEVSNDSVVCHLEDRRVPVLVDRHDNLGGAHPGEVLDRTRDPDGDVQRRADRLAGLS